ncbi:MAG TPA: hypothetical protein VFH43_04515 [Candidatus Kapabacteria bacterium]|nr:hypothetical protein [Candidatus Kapabacteria bacterium]
MNRDILFRRRSLAFRQGEPPDWIPERGSDRFNGDDVRTRLHRHQIVIPNTILLIESDPYYIDVIKDAVTESTISVATNWTQALKCLTDHLYDLIIVSVGRHAEIDTMDLIRFQRYQGDELNFFTPFIATIDEGCPWRATEAIHSGCLSAIQKPFTTSMIRGLIIDKYNNSSVRFIDRNDS